MLTRRPTPHKRAAAWVSDNFAVDGTLVCAVPAAPHPAAIASAATTAAGAPARRIVIADLQAPIAISPTGAVAIRLAWPPACSAQPCSERPPGRTRRSESVRRLRRHVAARDRRHDPALGVHHEDPLVAQVAGVSGRDGKPRGWPRFDVAHGRKADGRHVHVSDAGSGYRDTGDWPAGP